MIDYEKLKKACELAEQISKDTQICTKISCNFYEHDMDFDVIQKGVSMGFDYIDNLLQFLQQLTEPKPKFEVGQKLFVVSMYDHIISEVKIYSIEEKNKYLIEFKSGWHAYYQEDYLYLTKSELIQSQIDYWTKLKQEQEPCHHNWEQMAEQNKILMDSLAQEPCHPENEFRPTKYYTYCAHCKNIGNCFEDFKYGCPKNEYGYHEVHQTSEEYPYPVYNSLLEQSKEPCQHESDGILKDNSGTFELGCYKCIKCGEYYK